MAGFYRTSIAIFVVLLSIQMWRLSPRYPDGLGNASVARRFAETIVRSVFRFSVNAERLGLIDDSSEVIKKIMSFHRPEKEIKDLEVVETALDGVDVTIFRPASSGSTNTKQPCLVYYHGGGFTLGSTKSYAPWTALLAKSAGIVVVSVSYRLAPKNAFPIGLEDSLKATRAVFDNAQSLNIDRNRIAIGGDSSGANFAAVVALELAGSEKYPVKAQLLFSVVILPPGMLPINSYQYSHMYPFSADWYLTKYAGQHFTREIEARVFPRRLLTVKETKKIADRWNALMLPSDITALAKGISPLNIDGSGILDDEVARLPKEVVEVRKVALDKRSWPMLVEDDNKLKKVAPAFLSVAEFDMRRDEGLWYFAKLKSLGVPAVLSFLPNGEHIEPALNAMTASTQTAAARKGVEDTIEFIKKNL